MIENLLQKAFLEDLSDVGDVTSDAIFTANETDTYWLVAKQEGVLCGSDIFTQAFHYVDRTCKIKFYFSDGDILKSGDKVAQINGVINSLLKGERVALNFIS
ncbi:MAG: nicotinate-nucleotide diphosphorylase (carboxylating), partial [Desulfamplus sp.]|nr:nicotinate-nucleotide diphosphorylase (carboxylating) [Desulfamplus sp.]